IRSCFSCYRSSSSSTRSNASTPAPTGNINAAFDGDNCNEHIYETIDQQPSTSGTQGTRATAPQGANTNDPQGASTGRKTESRNTEVKSHWPPASRPQRARFVNLEPATSSTANGSKLRRHVPILASSAAATIGDDGTRPKFRTDRGSISSNSSTGSVDSLMLQAEQRVQAADARAKAIQATSKRVSADLMSILPENGKNLIKVNLKSNGMVKLEPSRKGKVLYEDARLVLAPTPENNGYWQLMVTIGEGRPASIVKNEETLSRLYGRHSFILKGQPFEFFIEMDGRCTLDYVGGTCIDGHGLRSTRL
ncbi:MAG: hypothetical protein ACRC9R_10740, partial [Enterovibrio sp.]